ncbi:hypothetical protein Tco_0809004 [Tanacetum coccineum]
MKPSNHEECIKNTGAAPKQQQHGVFLNQLLSQNNKLPVIQNGNSKKRISTRKDRVIRILPPVTATEIQAIEKERKAKNILLMAIPKEHMRRFHGNGMNAKEIREAIRTVGGNANSKKMQKAYSSTSSTNIPEKEVPAGFADEVIYFLFAKQSEDWDLLHEDLEQIDNVDIEKMDINWQISIIAIRMKKFYKKIGRRVRVDGKTPVGFDKKKLECFNCHNTEAGKQEKNQMGLLTMDDGIVNWREHTKVEETNHALIAISSSNEVTLCSKTCIDSYNTLKLLCDEQMNQLGDQEAQILAYSQTVKKLEAQLVTF